MAHEYDSVIGLSVKCKKCGYIQTIASIFASYKEPDCMFEAFSSEDSQKILATCECGASKIGVKPYTSGHSSWCPVK